MTNYVVESFSFSEELDLEIVELYAKEAAMVLGFDTVATEAVDVKAIKSKIATRAKACCCWLDF